MARKIKIAAPSGAKLAIPIVALLAVVAGLIAYATFTTYVRPNEFAVRQVYLGPNSGIQKDVFGPGLHFVLPGYERLHIFRRDVQLLEFNDTLSASQGAHTAPSIRIQTSEGYQVTVDVSIAYRVVDPYKVITQIGTGSLYETALMMPRSDKFLRQKLGELNAEEFYDGELRRQQALKVRDLLEPTSTRSGSRSGASWCATTPTTPATRKPSSSGRFRSDGLQEPR